MRKFEAVKNEFIKYNEYEVKLPIRSTNNSAGYDFYSPVDLVIAPNEIKVIWTNVKFICNSDEYLMLCVRSSMGKKGVRLANGVGIIDSDYYSNESNDGNIGFMLHNFGKDEFVISKNDRIGQGIIMKYLTADDDNVASSNRIGGIGSTN